MESPVGPSETIQACSSDNCDMVNCSWSIIWPCPSKPNRSVVKTFDPASITARCGVGVETTVARTVSAQSSSLQTFLSINDRSL